MMDDRNSKKLLQKVQNVISVTFHYGIIMD